MAMNPDDSSEAAPVPPNPDGAIAVPPPDRAASSGKELAIMTAPSDTAPRQRRPLLWTALVAVAFFTALKLLEVGLTPFEAAAGVNQLNNQSDYLFVRFASGDWIRNLLGFAALTALFIIWRPRLARAAAAWRSKNHA